MIGPLLNYTQRCYNLVDSINTGYQYKEDLFGTGTTNYTVTSGTTIYNRDLAARNGNSMEFKNLTIEKDSRLMPYAELGEPYGVTAQAGPWSTLFIKCSDTLTVSGTVTSAQTGSRFYKWDDRNINTASTALIPLDTGFYGYGFSALNSNYFRLSNLGANKSLFDFNLSMFGGAGGGCHRYVRRKWGRHHHDFSHNWGISCGGGGTGKASSEVGGSGGGFVALYFEHLIIDGKEYGVDAGCDITRISANGISLVSEGDRSGGSIVIAARTINLTGAGTINSDGGNAYWSPNVTRKRCFLNNFNQLNAGQYGWYWNPNTNDYAYGTPISDTYYYDDGTGNGLCNRKISGSTFKRVGGAGICIGFKVK